jgi:predicted AAA+ superfamily ATPase
MKRLLEQALVTWKDSKQRSPLILRGARQVGKTYLIEAFASLYFEHQFVINFEKNPEYANCFSTFEVKDILQKISVYQGRPIQAGNTLLFLDEIQACPAAIQALRYFKEDFPELHVIAAGSLLEFALQEPGFKMPVGRVQYLYLKPLSFTEYLEATQKFTWLEAIQKASLERPLPDILHQALINETKVYMMLGGMPAVVNHARDEGIMGAFQQTQHQILETYVDDFSKYASSAKQVHLKTVFDQLPNLIGQPTKYNKINPDVQSRFLKEAIHCLGLAGVLYQVYASTASGLPLNAQLHFNKYKLFFLDVGLLAAKSQLLPAVLMSHDILLVNRGEMAEQFVCQELLAYQPTYKSAHIQYWVREQKSSQAEVDFVIQIGTHIVPIEVKAGAIGRLKSLQVMMQEKQLPLGIRVSQLPLAYDEGKRILSLPFYLLSELPRLFESMC